MGVLGVEDLPYRLECDGEKPVCVGNAVRTCGEDGLWKDSECVGQTCLGGACAGECAPEQTRCVGNSVESCGVDGSFGSALACVTQTCVSGVCVGVCAPGETRCMGNSVESCGADGNFGGGVECVGQTCVGGACVGECEFGQQGCLGNTPRSCDASGTWVNGNACEAVCSGGACLVPPSCAGLQSNCGPGSNESCCASFVVPGGTYNRSNNASFPATVSDFGLDRFEITVGRFRKFVEAYPGSKPAAGAGAHPLIAGSGWDAAWDSKLPADKAGLIANVKCDATYEMWTDTPGKNENKPMNCISWYEVFSFCAFDGGRLPTEAEWNYAAAGGDEQREYPWSNPPSANLIDASYAVYNCLGDGPPAGQCAGDDILNVGSKSAKGDGKWGHADLSGSVYEWNLDWHANSYPSPFCNDCANVLNGSDRVLRGGCWEYVESLLVSHVRNAYPPEVHGDFFGGRCARTP